MREIWLKIAQTTGARIYSLIITNVIIFSLTARWLGPEGRGTIAAITTWVSLFSILGSLSLGPVAFHRATKMRDELWLNSTLGSLIFFAIAMTFIGWLTAAGLYFVSHGELFNQISPSLLLIGFLLLPFMLWEQYGSALLMAINQLNVYNVAQIKGRTVGVILVVLLLSLKWGVYGVFIATICSQIIVSSTGFKCLYEKANKSLKPNWIVIKELLKGAGQLHLRAIGNFLYMGSDILMINYYKGLEETGYYQLAVQLIGILLIIPTSASTVMSSKIAQLGPDQAWEYHRKLLLFMTLGMIGIGLAAGSVAPWLIPYFVGEAFAPSVPIFQLLLIGTVGMTFSIIMGSQWIGRGLFWQASLISIIVGVLNFIGNLILIPKYGMFGAVASTLATYTILIFGNASMAIWVNRRYKSYAPESLSPSSNI